MVQREVRVDGIGIGVEGREGGLVGEIQRGGGRGEEGPLEAHRRNKISGSHKEAGECLGTNFNP